MGIRTTRGGWMWRILQWRMTVCPMVQPPERVPTRCGTGISVPTSQWSGKDPPPNGNSPHPHVLPFHPPFENGTWLLQGQTATPFLSILYGTSTPSEFEFHRKLAKLFPDEVRVAVLASLSQAPCGVSHSILGAHSHGCLFWVSPLRKVTILHPSHCGPPLGTSKGREPLTRFGGGLNFLL